MSRLPEPRLPSRELPELWEFLSGFYSANAVDDLVIEDYLRNS